MALLLLFCCSVWLFAIPWTAACQASLSFTISQSLLKLMSIHLILCHPLLLLPSTFPSIRVFPMSQLFVLGGQRIGTSVSASVHPMNIHSWFPLGLTGFICLQSKGLSRVFSSTTIQKHQFFNAQPSLWSNFHIHTWLQETPQLWLYRPLLTKWCLCFLVCCLVCHSFFPPRSKCLLISWLLSPSAVISKPKKIKSATVSAFSPSICLEVMGPDAMILVFWMLSFKPVISQNQL